MAKISKTATVKVGAEGAVLKQLRIKKGLSMSQAGKLIGEQSLKKKPFSTTYISQIENFRIKPPKGIYLKPFLKVYGDISEKYFRELCRTWENEFTDEDFITLALPKLNDDDKKYLRRWIDDRLRNKF